MPREKNSPQAKFPLIVPSNFTSSIVMFAKLTLPDQPSNLLSRFDYPNLLPEYAYCKPSRPMIDPLMKMHIIRSVMYSPAGKKIVLHRTTNTEPPLTLSDTLSTRPLIKKPQLFDPRRLNALLLRKKSRFLLQTCVLYCERIMFSACLSFLLNRIFHKHSITLRRSPTTLRNLECLLYRLQSSVLSNLTSDEQPTTATDVQTSSFLTWFVNQLQSSRFKKPGHCYQS